MKPTAKDVPRASERASVPRALLALSILLVAAGVSLRVWGLDRLPGVNGDEAWYGVQVDAFLAGQGPQWLTPTGLPPNPLHVLPLAAIQAATAERSFWMLRLPSLLSGIVLLAVGYWIGGRLRGPWFALMFLILLATLPALVAASRFGWDASHSPLASLLCLAGALSLRPAAATAAFGLALWVHPTNVFLAPAAILGSLGAALEPAGKAHASAASRRFRALGVAVGLSAVAAAFGLIVPRESASPAQWMDRLYNPTGWLDLVRLTGESTSGATVERFVAGPLPPAAAKIQAALFWSFACLILALGGRRLALARRWSDLGVGIGWASGLALLYLLGGLRPLEPDFERYAMFHLVPACWFAAALVDGAIGHPSRFPPSMKTAAFRPWVAWLPIAAGSLGIVSLTLFYFGPHLSPRPLAAHRTFRSGPEEPKRAAFDAIRARSSGKPALLLCEDWWTYWPIRYLAASEPSWRIVRWDDPDLTSLPVDADSGARIFLVGFPGGALAGSVRSPIQRIDVADRGGACALVILETGDAPAPMGSEARPRR